MPIKGAILKSTNKSVTIPFGKTHFLEPRKWYRIILPWTVNIQGHLTVVCAVNVKGLISSYSMGEKGTIHVLVLNSSNNVTVITPRSAAIRLLDVDECIIKRIEDRKSVV